MHPQKSRQLRSCAPRRRQPTQRQIQRHQQQLQENQEQQWMNATRPQLTSRPSQSTETRTILLPPDRENLQHPKNEHLFRLIKDVKELSWMSHRVICF